LEEVPYDKSKPWGYFDGACQGPGSLCGIGICIFFSGKHVISAKANLGSGSNNQSEFTALFYLLKVSLERGITHIQVYAIW